MALHLGALLLRYAAFCAATNEGGLNRRDAVGADVITAHKQPTVLTAATPILAHFIPPHAPHLSHYTTCTPFLTMLRWHVFLHMPPFCIGNNRFACTGIPLNLQRPISRATTGTGCYIALLLFNNRHAHTTHQPSVCPTIPLVTCRRAGPHRDSLHLWCHVFLSSKTQPVSVPCPCLSVPLSLCPAWVCLLHACHGISLS